MVESGKTCQPLFSHFRQSISITFPRRLQATGMGSRETIARGDLEVGKCFPMKRLFVRDVVDGNG